MTTFTLTDLPPRLCRRETFRAQAFRVVSRSGLHPTEIALIQALPPQVAGDVLITGNRTGAVGLIAAALYPQQRVVQHALDLHHARALERALAANGGAAIRTACTPFLPADGMPDLALMQATSHDTPAELILDQLEDLHARLRAEGHTLVAYDGKPDWLRKQMKRVFGTVHATPVAAGVTLFRATRRASDPHNRRDFSAAFEASVPGGAPCPFTTLPGVFAHRRPDEGGLALAEVASRGLPSDARILDLGCGCGLAGILLARQAPGAQVLCVDSSARAIYCTERNARANGLDHVQTRLSDTGTDETGFTLFIGNPPYFADFKIAELFIRTAYRALAPGGTAYVVAKSFRWHENLMRGLFGHAETIHRRGYGVVKATKA